MKTTWTLLGSSWGKRTSMLLVAAAAWACVAQADRENDAPPQGWWHERGPVVPHDSFPADCSLCHQGDDWTTLRPDFRFDHADETGLELLGAHKAAECLRCHNDRGPVDTFAARGCAGCHEDLHRGQLGKNCESCHDETDWRPSEQIALHDATRLPLVGAHAAAPCWRCHKGAQVGDFSHASVECLSCHQAALAQTTKPDHILQGFSLNCEDCHDSISWNNALFNHAGIFTGCIDCHLVDFNATTDPDHIQLGLSQNCEDCHDTISWDGALFSHDGIFSGCVDCHLSDYNATTDPDHAQQNFSLNCEDCHDTVDWDNAMFSHTGVFNGCIDCHQADYNTASNPNHLSAGISVECQDCHGTGSWMPANFIHDTAIAKNDHKSLDCSDCHLNPSNFMSFSCTNCHKKPKMDDEHDGEQGYIYLSSACFDCHPNGKKP